MSRLVAMLASPGVKREIQAAAPILIRPSQPSDATGVDESKATTVSPVPGIETGYKIKSANSVLDRALDHLVRASGSEPVFLLILAGLIAWAFLGIPYGSSDDWAIVISDVQAIISYAFDSLLMRQQLTSYEEFVRVSAILRSRGFTRQRLLRHILQSGQWRIREPDISGSWRPDQIGFAAQLPAENWVGKISTATSNIFGHFVTICIYWGCIFTWLGFGPSTGWSDQWQLYINSATSALMVLVFAFLANIRERHSVYASSCLNIIFEVDSSVELKLRSLAGDSMDNPTVTVPAPKVGRFQRAIFYYADVVGTLVGLAILVLVMVTWAAIGPVMGFGPNWWLLIGTYAGLVGLNDGFVLRNVQARLNDYENAAFEEVRLQDSGLFDELQLPDPVEESTKVNSISQRCSVRMNHICASEITVILGVLFIVGLLVGASAMHWNLTGQLLCNIPPSIIESFFMIILITGHNHAESERRADLYNMYLRRLRLLAVVNQLERVA